MTAVMTQKFGAFVLFIAAVSLLFSACAQNPPGPVRSAAVSASFEANGISSGSSTMLDVDATNNGTEIINGTFRIQPENDHVSAESRADVFVLHTGESAGQKRYNVTGRAQSTNESIQVTVAFVDATTQETLGSTTAFLQVHK